MRTTLCTVLVTGFLTCGLASTGSASRSVSEPGTAPGVASVFAPGPATGPAPGTASVFAPGIEIVPTEEVLQQHTDWINGELYFRHPNGARVRFLTDINDPEIPNRGDGQYHPVSVQDVQNALSELPAEVLQELECSIFILPYPRSGLLSSSADGGAIYLSPGVREYSSAQIYFLVAHEIGHVFQRRHFPETDRQGWAAYRQLRRIEDETLFADAASHAYQPREVFAEDFRVLFGGPLARGNGEVENRTLRSPAEVPGLVSFFRELAGMAPEIAPEFASEFQIEAGTWSLSPNPSGPRSRVTLAASTSRTLVSLALIDVSGRKVAEPRFHASGDRSWTLDLGPGMMGRGVYFLRVRTADGQSSTLSLRRLS